VLGRATPYLLVAVGGALGAVARFAVANGFARRLGTSWPYATLCINLSGCFFIALFLAAASERNFDPAWRYLFPTGFVGAYTTFSTYGYETVRLIETGRTAAAAAYVLASNLLGLGAILLGSWVARR